LLLPAVAAADVVPVANTNDSGPGSLRQAIADADPGDTIRIPRGRYELSTALEVDKPLAFKGAGARRTVIDANRLSRVFEIDGGLGTVRMTGLTVREGDTDGMGSGAGMIVGSGTKLILVGVAVLNNHAITLTNFSNGGGVESSDRVVVKRSLFARNHAYNGGALNASAGFRAVASTFSGNVGGNPVFNGDSGVTNTDGTFIDSTLAGNRCFNGSGCGAVAFAEIRLRGTLLAKNRAYRDNGIPAGDPGNRGVPDGCAEPAVSLGHNLEDFRGKNSCELSKRSDVVGRKARLKPLRFNGGQTQTHAIGKRSPALDKGGKACGRRDQRKVKRPQGKRCDIGAYELELKR
jgi:hypothetical protein